MMVGGILISTFPCPCNVIPACSAGQFGSRQTQQLGRSTAKDSWAESYCCIAKMPGKVDTYTYIQILYMSAETVYILYILYIIYILSESIYKSYLRMCLYVLISFTDYEGPQWNIHSLKSEWETKVCHSNNQGNETPWTTLIFKSQ